MSSIDDDIASLVEELHLRSELTQAAEAIVDSDKFAVYLNQKAVIAIDRFFVSTIILYLVCSFAFLENNSSNFVCRLCRVGLSGLLA